MDPTRPLTIPSINPFIQDKRGSSKNIEPIGSSTTIQQDFSKTDNLQNSFKADNQPDSSNEDFEQKDNDTNNIAVNNQESRVDAHPINGARDQNSCTKPINAYVSLSTAATWCPCGTCGVGIDIPGVDWILCDSCSNWFHGSCANLTEDDLRRLADPSIIWNCSKCEILNRQPNSTQHSTNYITCKRCADSGTIKNCKGSRGLKQHYNHAHKDFLADLIVQAQPTTPCDFQAKLCQFKQKIRVLKRIPQGARTFAAIKLEQLINTCLMKNDIDSWNELFSFAYIALRTPRRYSKKNKLSTIIKNNIFNWNESTLEETIKPNKSSSLSKRVESKISDGDVKGAIKILSSSDQLAPQNSETYIQLQEKHPPPSRPLSFPDPPNPSDNTLTVNELEVMQGIYSFPNGSASGIDGICPQVLKDLISKSNGEAGRRLITAITKLCNFMLEGGINTEIVAILYGASLCALRKKDGGLRPIAVGNTFRRLTAKLACKSVKESIGAYFRPKQLGFATRGGCEAAIHATRTYLEKNSGSEKILLKIDFKNAFNTVERDTMLAAIKEKTPQLYPFLWQCYSSSSFLFFGQDVIPSQVGAQQGDPAGPMAFSLAIQPIIESLLSELNIWYLDDGTLAGDSETVLADFKTIIERCKSIGLEVNPAKCELFFCSAEDKSIHEKFAKLSPGIKIIREDLTLLGSPLTDAAAETLLKKKLEELGILFARLRGLNSHIAYFLLKNCLAIPKLIYIIRTCPTWRFKDLISQFDDAIRKTLQAIVNSTLTEDKWILSSLPIKNGGLGVRRVCDVGLPAFLASVNAVFDLVCDMLHSNTNAAISDISFYGEAIEAWKELCQDSPVPTIPSMQQNWDSMNVKRMVETLPLINDIDKARYNASTAKESNAWLSALPSKNIGLLLNNNDFRISVALRLGLDICAPHTCVCGQQVDSSGIHGLSCLKSAGRFSRHSCLNDLIKRAFLSAEIPSTLEPCGLIRDDGKRPDGMTLVPWKCGQSLVWDATCTDSLAPSHIKASSTSVGSAAETAANLKKNKYKAIIDQNYIFVPFAVETLGPWCEDARLIVDSLGGRISRITGEPKSKFYLTQRISIAIQRGNAACIMGTLPPAIPMEEMFLIL